MSLSRDKSSLRAIRWLAPAAALAFAPKCALCVAAYLGLGTALGLGGPELCGVSASAGPGWWLSTFAAGLVATAVLLLWRLRQAHSARVLAPQSDRRSSRGRERWLGRGRQDSTSTGAGESAESDEECSCAEKLEA